MEEKLLLNRVKSRMQSLYFFFFQSHVGVKGSEMPQGDLGNFKLLLKTHLEINLRRIQVSSAINSYISKNHSNKMNANSS